MRAVVDRQFQGIDTRTPVPVGVGVCVNPRHGESLPVPGVAFAGGHRFDVVRAVMNGELYRINAGTAFIVGVRIRVRA